ncbi:MAG: NTP transferase domain-containing protein, partial [Candidatus Hydrogenedentes bacterium]|nr:NTP transferase domain-containing protein [Candidatus Hydrogenedentota bacterium]
MISGILLAAGESRRMGVQKLLLPYGGKTMIEHIVDEA